MWIESAEVEEAAMQFQRLLMRRRIFGALDHWWDWNKTGVELLESHGEERWSSQSTPGRAQRMPRGRQARSLSSCFIWSLISSAFAGISREVQDDDTAIPR